MQKTRIALIPAYQPDQILISLVNELDSKGFLVITVNDGSSSDYDRIFQQFCASAIQISYAENHGKGYALKYGLSKIQEMNLQGTIVTVDADGQHTAEDACRLAEISEQEPESLILGSRTQGRNSPFKSRYGNWITQKIFRSVSGVSVQDTQTGLRAFSAQQIPFLLDVDGNRYDYEMNVLLKWTRAGKPIHEIGIQTIYIHGNHSSHFNAFRDSILIYAQIFKFCLSSIVCFLIDYGLFSLFASMTSGMDPLRSIFLANAGARIISASCNYYLNRRYVFQSHTEIRRSLIQYIFLAGCIFAGNTAVLEMLTSLLHMNRYLAKIMTEILFFAISWKIQNSVIFGKPDPSGKGESVHEI